MSRLMFMVVSRRRSPSTMRLASMCSRMAKTSASDRLSTRRDPSILTASQMPWATEAPARGGGAVAAGGHGVGVRQAVHATRPVDLDGLADALGHGGADAVDVGEGDR